LGQSCADLWNIPISLAIGKAHKSQNRDDDEMNWPTCFPSGKPRLYESRGNDRTKCATGRARATAVERAGISEPREC